jgi:hypothetical protein
VSRTVTKSTPMRTLPVAQHGGDTDFQLRPPGATRREVEEQLSVPRVVSGVRPTLASLREVSGNSPRTLVESAARGESSGFTFQSPRGAERSPRSGLERVTEPPRSRSSAP